VKASVSFAALLVLALAATGALAQDSPQTQTAPAEKPSGRDKAKAEPDHIKVQHILISFKGKLPGKDITRTKDEARQLAYEVLELAKGERDFGELVAEYTDDQAPGIYGMSNHGASPKPGEMPRARMVAAFGDVGFRLELGEIGIADYSFRTSPYGWHIIKRIE
jgi:hypothetical protein